MRPIYSEKRVPESNQNRFIKIGVQPTLFGEWAFVREWGRIGQGGTIKELWFDSKGEAMHAARQYLSDKQRRGYRSLANLPPGQQFSAFGGGKKSPAEAGLSRQNQASDSSSTSSSSSSA